MAGIYIHIPFCKQACSYCNFHFSTSLAQRESFLAALNKEIEITASISKEKIETIYFGGGTPSLLAPDAIDNIIRSLYKKFHVADDVEITLEANPDDINLEILYAWKKYGINRLSLGVQSFKETELIWMNRAHRAADSLQSINDILTAGFNNFSVDLIYGSPFLSDDELVKNLDIIFEKQIPHISCYALTVEPKTALSKMISDRKELTILPEKQASQFLLLMDWMKDINLNITRSAILQNRFSKQAQQQLLERKILLWFWPFSTFI